MWVMFVSQVCSHQAYILSSPLSSDQGRSVPPGAVPTFLFAAGHSLTYCPTPSPLPLPTPLPSLLESPQAAPPRKTVASHINLP